MDKSNGSRPVEQGYVEVNGAPLYYESVGSGYPLVLAHRGLLDRRMWDDQFHAFADEYRVIRYDIRGSGQSKIIPEHFGHHEDLGGLLDALGVDRVHLVGLALGASISLDFALDSPARVTALVLASPSLGGYRQISAAMKAYQARLFHFLARMNPDDAVQLSLQMWLAGPYRSADEIDAAVRARVQEMMTDALWKPLESYLPKMLEPLAAARLAEVNVPTLILTGDKDVEDTQDIATILAREIRGATRIDVPGSGHLINMERPTEFNRLVRDFLKAQEV